MTFTPGRGYQSGDVVVEPPDPNTPGVWMTYKTEFKPTSDPRDAVVKLYTGISVWASEIEALRFANSFGLKAVWVPFGRTLEDALDQFRQREQRLTR